MKRIITFLLIAALTFALYGCTESTTNNSGNNGTQSTSSTTSNSSESIDSSEPVSSESENTGTLSETEAIDIANKLFDDIDKLDRLAACAIEADSEQSITVDDNQYALVTDEDFASLQDLVNFTKSTITANVSRYSSLYNGNSTSYVEKDGKLYVALEGKGCGFYYIGEATVSDITENSYVAERTYDNYGGVATLKIKVVLDDGSWKIDDIIFEE